MGVPWGGLGREVVVVTSDGVPLPVVVARAGLVFEEGSADASVVVALDRGDLIDGSAGTLVVPESGGTEPSDCAHTKEVAKMKIIATMLGIRRARAFVEHKL